MTVRVTTLKGGDAGLYYTRELGRYYLDGGEPPGQWFGDQAFELGLVGELEPNEFLALMAGRDPVDGHVLGRAYGESSARGYDVTFNAPKSVSLLYAFGDAEVRRQVVAGHQAAVATALGWLQEQAHTRVTPNGATLVVDTRGLAVGLFQQHTSRTGDPHLHTHAVVIAKVQAAHWGWYALDARLLLKDQRTLSALYHAGLRAELTRRLGVRWRTPDNGIAELAGFDDRVLSRFSTRTDQLDARLQDKLDRFRITFEREPTERERWRLEREAARDSRPNKNSSVAGSVLSVRWRAELAAAGLDPDELTRHVIGRQLASTGIAREQGASLAAAARAELADTMSTWRANDVVREIARRVPTTVTVPAFDLVDWIDHAARTVQPGEVELAPDAPAGTSVRRDGRPVTESDVDRRFTTEVILAQEEFIASWALDRLEQPGQPALLPRGRLDRAQHAAAQAVAGSEPLVIVVGPAGAGKTASLRAAVDHLRQHFRPVVGLAPSATAAAVLQTSTRARSDTVDKLLHEHRQHAGRGNSFPAGTTVLVDEASMLPTPKLAELARLADQQRWRIVLIGDPRQLPAVGRGGMFAHLAASGDIVELDRIHRFTEPWERTASLSLRRGDPDVLDRYIAHGRIHEGSTIDMRRAALIAWSEHRRDGEQVVMLAVSNDTVGELNREVQRLRLEAGELDAARSVQGRGYRVHVGDEIVTRHNDRRLRTDHGTMVRNRAHWTITRIDRGGAIEAAGPDGTIVLPADYVSAAVELGYAQTVHGAQGRTVDHALLVIDGSLDGRGLYVGMTRGAHSNHAYITTDGNRTARDILEAALAGDWADTPAIDRRADLRDRPALRVAPVIEPGPPETSAAERLGRLGNQRRPPDRGLGLGR